MNKTFYQFLMTQRNPGSTDPIAEFANNAFYDQSFPKQLDEFDSLSKYLEENASYLPNMEIFDEVWKMYEESM
ncbi:YozE family protein [Lentilactobacillus sp. IMAU92037]|uniref:YozE family protein n=1 Tax=Lentilactobacillus TaxID=2767893 RepID=UPI001C2727FA|nr:MULTISPECIES: YozE family protein [Lentilactobacillus]MBU9787966.1 YozE family protein [Lentilactobacillus dabitei]MBV0930080.1 YozE family protein [Lentilactobacillus dabitei]MDM7515870.1 YozE family protein [Lentilactobacillus sp. TOM.63]